MASAEPPFLMVGTDVSAKYRGAFCEAKIKKVEKLVKCKVTLKDNSPPIVVKDEDVTGPLKIGATVEVKHPDSGQNVEATIQSMKDSSMYHVVFNDGDQATLRRTQLCLKGEKHFVESETLDQLPLTHPEHFGTPVMGASKKGKKSQAKDDDSESESEEETPRKRKITKTKTRSELMVGKVVCIGYGDKKKGSWFPALVVRPAAHETEIRSRDQYLVRSFKDNRFSAVSKRDVKEFTREMALKNEDKTLKVAIEKALLYVDNRELPSNWDREKMLGEESDDDESEEESSDDEPSEEKDRFVAQLYKFMDDRGTPINKAPALGNKDLNLYKLFKLVQNIGGYNRVTNQMKWRLVYSKLQLPPNNNASYQIKQAYKKYLHAFEDFYRKLGSTMGTISRPGRSRHGSGRSILSFREREKEMPRSPKMEEKKSEKDTPNDKKPAPKEVEKLKAEENTKSEDEVEGSPRRGRRLSKMAESEDDSPKKRISRSESKAELEKEKKGIKKEEDKVCTRSDTDETPTRRRQEERRAAEKKENGQKNNDEKKNAKAVEDKKTPKLEPMPRPDSPRRGRPSKAVDKKSPKVTPNTSGRESDSESVNTEGDESKVAKKRTGRRKSGKGEDKEEAGPKSKDNADDDDDPPAEPSTKPGIYQVGTKVKVKYGRGRNQKVYEAKIIETEMENGTMHYLVHYAGWNIRYDEWVKKDRICFTFDKPDTPKQSSKPKSAPSTPLNTMKSPPKPQSLPQSPVAQLLPVAKRRPGRPPITVPGKSSTPDVKPSLNNTSSTNTRSKSPASATGPSKPRPTRSNSLEVNLAHGLPAKRRRPRRSSGVTECSEQLSSESESDVSDTEKDTKLDDVDSTKEPSVKDETIEPVNQEKQEQEATKDSGKKDTKKEKEMAKVSKPEPKASVFEFDDEDDDLMEPNRPLMETKKSKISDTVDSIIKHMEVIDQEEKKVEKEKGAKKEENKGKKEQKKDVKTDVKECKVEKEEEEKQEEMEVDETKTAVPDVKETAKGKVKKKDLESEKGTPAATKDTKKRRVSADSNKKDAKPVVADADDAAQADVSMDAVPEEEAETVQEEVKDVAAMATEEESKMDTASAKKDKKKKTKETKEKKDPKDKKESEPVKKGKAEKEEENDGKDADKSKGKKKGKKKKEKVTAEVPEEDVESNSEVKSGDQIDESVKLECDEEVPRSRSVSPVAGQQEDVKSPLALQPVSEQATPGTSHSNQAANEIFQREDAPASSTVLDNTPPTTPEGSPRAEPPNENSSIQSSVSYGLKADSQEDLSSYFEAEQCSMNASGGESPNNVSTASTDSGSNGNVPSSESSGDAGNNGITSKRKIEVEEQAAPPKRRKQRHRRNHTGDKNKHRHKHNGASDSDETNNEGLASSVASSLAGSTQTSPTKPVITRSPRPSKYNFNNLDDVQDLEGEKRIAILQEKISEIRKVYMALKAEVATIDRRRKRARRKEREGRAQVQQQQQQAATVEMDCS